MIQRIQSLYLFLSIFFIALLLFFPYVTYVSNEGITYYLMHNGLFKKSESELFPVYYNLSITIFIAIVIALNILAIFMYKNRPYQMKLNKISIFVLFVIFGSLIIQLFRTKTSFVGFEIKIIFFVPLFSLIFVWLAYRAIKKDDELIRSIDRIR